MDKFEFIENSDEEFISEEEIKTLNEEAQIMGKSIPDQAEKLFEENVLRAVLTISKLCDLASSDTIKFNAAKYIIDRVLGQPGKQVQDTAMGDFLKDLNKLGENVTI